MPLTKTGKRVLRSMEWSSYAGGLALTGFFVVQLAQGEVERREGLEEFAALSQQATVLAQVQADEAVPAADKTLPFELPDNPDTALWAPGRVADYEASLQADLPPVLGVLEVPAVGLEVPVYSTSTELTMDRGAGVIDGMAYPHEPGNIGISGHRDGYFRVLKDVKLGDKLILQTLEGPKQFTVSDTRIVEISDTHVLQDTDDTRVTLVTCYPFYFVGHAPQRFIVTASLDTTNVNQ